MLLHEYLEKSAARFPDKVALITGSKEYTYSDLWEAARAFAGYLIQSGMQKGDRVLVFQENSAEAVIAIFGTLAAGGCFVVVNPTTPVDRVKYLQGHSGARYLICPAERAAELQECPPAAGISGRTVTTGAKDGPVAGIPWEHVIARASSRALPPLVSTDLAAIIYTSGSTGKPKGVTLTHLNVETVAESVEEYLEHSAQDRVLCVLQLSFGYGLLQLLVTFRSGGTLLLEKGFGYPYDIVAKLKQHNVTGFAGVPTLFALLLQLSDLEREDFPYLRYMTNAAAAMPQSFLPRLRRIFPRTRLYLMHGLTEVLRTTFLPPEQIERRPLSVGKGMRNVELWIEDEDGNLLGPGKVGELVVRGANVMVGYWNDAEATSKVLLPGRYPWEHVMHSRDLFTMDEDGYLTFVARMDDVIKCKGEKVSPLEVENVLYELSDVVECRVIGVPDPVYGESVRAEIVARNGRRIEEKDVKAHCRLRLEEYKVPHQVAFVREIPKTEGGKIRRN